MCKWTKPFLAGTAVKLLFRFIYHSFQICTSVTKSFQSVTGQYLKGLVYAITVLLGIHTNTVLAATGVASISGVAEQGQTLTANLADDDGVTTSTPAYQWKRNSFDIGGATGITYLLTQDDVNSSITVTISYIDDLLNPENVTSAATGTVANINDAPTGGVSITGVATEGQTLTADTATINDIDGLTAFTYQWQRGGVNVGSNSSTYFLTQFDVGETITVTISYTDGGGTLESLTSVPSATIADSNVAPTGGVSITGNPTEGQTLTAFNDIADANGLGSFTYQWQRGGVNVGSNSSTYFLTQADVGETITVTISYTDGAGTLESLTSAPSATIADSNVAPTGSVSITGNPTEGQTLTAINDIADANGLGPFTYQWQRGEINVGSNSSTYFLTQFDVGETITVTISYTDGAGTLESLTSALSATIADSNVAPTGGVSITGNPTEGQNLTAINDIADANGLGPFTYQWQRGGVNVGSNSSTYFLTQFDVGETITVTISYTDGAGTLESLTSAPSATIADSNVAPTGSVSITGNPTEGQTLTAINDIADVNGLGPFTYQWQRGGVNVGSNNSTYFLTQGDVGNTLTVTISFTDGAGTLESLTSAPSDTIIDINHPPVGIPVVIGSPSEGVTLTADVSAVTDSDGIGQINYQWLRNNIEVASATGSSYTLVQDDVNSPISVRMTYTDGGGNEESVTSLPTSAISNVNNLPAGNLLILGNSQQNETLTADISNITDEDGLNPAEFVYQWFRSGSPLTGANTSSYTLVQDDVNTVISVSISYTDGFGTPESVISDGTGAVVNINDLPVGVPVINGNITQGEVLTADVSGISDLDGLGVFTYQWLRDDVDITDATANSYVLTQQDVDAFIKVRISYTDGQATQESVISNPVGPIINVNDPGIVSIVGDATDGSLISVADITDIDGTSSSNFSYQWKRDGVNITGETDDSYRIVTADIGTFISVVVSYVDDQATPETVVSNTIGAIRPDLPKVTPPPNIAPVNATGWFTYVDLDPGSVATAFDTLDNAFIKPVPDSNGQFRPGETIVTWSATDEAGNVGVATQVVKVIPLVDISKIQRVAEGSSAELRVSLNGDALQYPVTVPFTVSNSDLGTGSANSDDHTLVNESISINEPAPGELPSAAINFDVVDDGVGEGVENLIVTLGQSPTHAVLGPIASQTIEIQEGNVAPRVNLEASQLQLDNNSGTVTIFAIASDANDDALSYNWSGTDNTINGSEPADGIFTLDATGLSPGIYTIAVEVSDGVLSASDSLVLRVSDGLPGLSSSEDTDGDAALDADEGYSDDDGDGIADYLDAIEVGQVIQILPGISGEFVMQTEADLKLTLGDIAVKANKGSTLVDEDDVTNPAFGGSAADTIENIGGYFDFTITGLSVPGQVVNVVIPQLTEMPRVSVYRKLTASGWQDFVLNEKNKVSSAMGEKGYCPPPGDAAYKEGLTQGHWCLQLTIEDGGPNDDDGEANYRITDPGGIGRVLSSVTVNSSGGGGGSFSPLVVLLSAFVLFVLRTIGWKKRKNVWNTFALNKDTTTDLFFIFNRLSRWPGVLRSSFPYSVSTRKLQQHQNKKYPDSASA